MKTKANRKDWKLEPKIRCGWTKDMFVIIPTIVYFPWKFRYANCPGFAVYWLGFYMDFGDWKVNERS